MDWWDWTPWPEYWRWSLAWEPNDPKYVWVGKNLGGVFIQSGHSGLSCCFAENEL
jgi:hypothetical protein